MKIKSLVIFFLVLLLAVQPFFTNPSIAFQPVHSKDENPILYAIENNIIKTIYSTIFAYNIGTGDRPKYVYSDPDIIELDYLENISTEIIFGNPARQLSGYQDRVNYETYISFKAEFPPDIPADAFSVQFNPPLIDLREYHNQKLREGYDPSKDSNNPIPNPRSIMHLKCEIPFDPNNPINDFILTINMTYTQKFRNFLENKTFGPLFGQLTSLLFLRAFSTAGSHNRYGELYVKMKPFRYAEMDVIETQPIQMRLNDMHMTQVNIQNRGNFPEQYGFRISGQKGSLNVNTPPPVTLYPGEIRTVQIGLITKPIAYDRGTLHSVDIELYPSDNPNETLAESTISVRTQGFALQSVFRFRFSWHIFFIVSFLIFILIALAIYRRIRIRQLHQKPRKPWTLPEEKQHLQKLLQKKDKKTYEHELTMMKQEYQSALLTHKTQLKHDLKQLRKQSRLYQLFGKILTVPKLPKPQPKPKKEKPKKKPPTKTKSVTKPKKPKQKNTKPVKPTLSKDIQKQQLMEKIKKQQSPSK